MLPTVCRVCLESSPENRTTYTAAISGDVTASQQRKNPIDIMERTRGKLTKGDIHPNVDPDVMANISNMSETVTGLVNIMDGTRWSYLSTPTHPRYQSS
jgi:hypothetical protein